VSNKSISYIAIVTVLALLALSSLNYIHVYAQYTGTAYIGNYLAVGVNDFGALGIDDPIYNDIGFQYPIGYNFESIALGWWGDGWSIFYNSEDAGFSPSDDAWGNIAGVTSNVNIEPTPYGYIERITLITIDGVLNITFIYHIFTSEKFIVVETIITNIGPTTLTNVEHKRIVDWDVWKPTIGTYSNYWGMDDIRRPDLNLVVASYNYEVFMGFASLETPYNYDLDWSDYDDRGFIGALHGSISADGAFPYYFDGVAIYGWMLGDLSPGESISIHLVYAAGDSLEELENIVSKAFGFIKSSILMEILSYGRAHIYDPLSGWIRGVGELEIYGVSGSLTINSRYGPLSFDMEIDRIGYDNSGNVIFYGVLRLDGYTNLVTLFIDIDRGRVVLGGQGIIFIGTYR